MTQAPLMLAGRPMPINSAVKLLGDYPCRTPWKYDATPDELAKLSTQQRLQRTRKLNSRLSDAQVAEMAKRAETAPWDDRLAYADLASIRAGDDLWVAADALYLHFLHPKIAGVSFAKVHKYLHLVYPNLFPIIDSRLRRAYQNAERALAPESGLEGTDQWRRRTWLAIAADLKLNRENGAMLTVRERTEAIAARGTEDRARNLRRLLDVSDLRLLDMLIWRE